MAGLKERVKHRLSHDETSVPPSFKTDAPDPVEVSGSEQPKHNDPVERDRNKSHPNKTREGQR